jgi:hypothetical protein
MPLDDSRPYHVHHGHDCHVAYQDGNRALDAVCTIDGLEHSWMFRWALGDAPRLAHYIGARSPEWGMPPGVAAYLARMVRLVEATCSPEYAQRRFAREVGL